MTLFKLNVYRWSDERGGDRDEREAEGGENKTRGQLRDGQARLGRAHAEVHRQQAAAKRLREVQPPKDHDQGDLI